MRIQVVAQASFHSVWARDQKHPEQPILRPLFDSAVPHDGACLVLDHGVPALLFSLVYGLAILPPLSVLGLGIWNSLHGDLEDRRPVVRCGNPQPVFHTNPLP
jgi:hypothetical protein